MSDVILRALIGAAIEAMKAVLGGPQVFNFAKQDVVTIMAQTMYGIADAMMDARAAEKVKP